MMNYTFGFKKQPKQFSQIIKYMIVGFFCMIFFTLISILFPLFSIIIQASDDPKQLFYIDLDQLAQYTDIIDPQITQVLEHIKSIKSSYMSGQNIFATHESEIVFILNMVQTHYTQLVQYLPPQYKYFTDQLYDLSFHYQTIKKYLGAEQVQYYLVILQNTSEKRPNGGFFGSFAIVTVQGGHIKRFKIIDSYYPNYVSPDATVRAPERAKAFLPTLDMGFVSINKFGFTDIDGRHIADLYQKVFGRPISGVIFVRTDLFSYILPDFQEQIRNLQFMNATVDLRRKQNLPNKKEYYLNYINTYFAAHKEDIIAKIIKNIEYISQQHWIQIYLTDTTPGLNTRIQKNNLTTIYHTGMMYLRDTNIAYNKLDSFVTKYAELKTTTGLMISQTENDYLDIAHVESGFYDLTIYYHLNIIPKYKQYIKQLTQQNNLILNEREQHILGLTNTRDTRGMIYMPPNYKLLEYEGDQYDIYNFETPFSQNIIYKIQNTHNHSTKKITLHLQIQ